MKIFSRLLWLAPLTLSIQAYGAEIALRSHDATYAMKQVRQFERNWSSVERADGVLRFRFRNTCDGWTTEHQSAMHFDFENNQQSQMVWSYTSWESHDGTRLRFRSRMKRNGVVEESYNGEARKENNQVVAVYAEPNGRREEMPKNTAFPTSHLLDALKRAQKGETVFSASYFDGSGEDADYEVDTVLTPFSGKALSKVRETSLPPMPAWNMQLALHVPGSQDSIADMEIQARYRLDGVSTKLVQDFGDFVLEGELVELTYVDEPVCPR